MKIVQKTQTKKFQAGGQIPVEAAGAPVPPEAGMGGQQDPMVILIEAAMQAVQNQDPNMAMEVCMMLLELAGAAPAPVGAQAPEGAQPVFKKGGKLSRYTSPLDKFRK